MRSAVESFVFFRPKSVESGRVARIKMTVVTATVLLVGEQMPERALLVIGLEECAVPVDVVEVPNEINKRLY